MKIDGRIINKNKKMSFLMEQLNLSLQEEFNFAIQEELYWYFLSSEFDIIFWYYGFLFILVMYFTNGTDSTNLTIKNKENSKKNKKNSKKNKNKNKNKNKSKNLHNHNTLKHVEFILRNGKKRNRFSGKFH